MRDRLQYGGRGNEEGFRTYRLAEDDSKGQPKTWPGGSDGTFEYDHVKTSAKDSTIKKHQLIIDTGEQILRKHDVVEIVCSDPSRPLGVSFGLVDSVDGTTARVHVKDCCHDSQELDVTKVTS